MTHAELMKKIKQVTAEPDYKNSIIDRISTRSGNKKKSAKQEIGGKLAITDLLNSAKSCDHTSKNVDRIVDQ